MSASRSPLLADLKKAFAVAHLCNERTARRHFNRQSPEWQAFIAKQGIQAAKNIREAAPSSPAQATALQILGPVTPTGIERPSAADQPDESLPEPARMLKHQWEIYDHATRAWNRAIQEGDEIKALAFGQATIKAQDAYYKAKARHDQWELDERRKIPANEFLAFRAAFIQPLANLLRNLCFQLGPIMNPTDSAFAIRVGNEHMVATVHPQLTRMIDAMEDKIPVAA